MDAATDWVADTSNGGVRALDFDAVNDRVIAGATPTGSLAAGALSFWVYPRTDISRKYHLIYTNNSTNGLYVYVSTVGGLGQAFTIAIGAGSYPKRSTSGTNCTGDAWNHALFTWSANTVYFYLNGSAIGSAAFPNDPVFVATTTIAGPLSGNAEILNGRMDDIRMFDVSLDASDIAYLYNSGNGRGIIVESPSIPSAIYHPFASLKHPLTF